MKRLLLVLAFALVLSDGAFAEEISATTIEYKDANMTIEFIENEIVIGQATLISHKTYDEVLEITSGKDRIVIWYEFSEFESIKENAIIGVEFIDMRKEIFDYQGEEPLEEFEINKHIVPNPDYLQPVEKEYKLVYQENEKWLPYNSTNIPSEKIIIGVQTDLNWGEYLDIQLEIMNNRLDKHAMALGTNTGFVTDAPVNDPGGVPGGILDTWATALRDTSPATATKITEIGFWVNADTSEADMEVGIYDHDSENNVPGDLIGSEIGTKTTGGAQWKSITGLNISISPDTIYWIAVQVDNTTPNQDTDYSSSLGTYVDFLSGQLSLPSNWGGGSSSSTSRAFYAVWEAAPADTFDFTISMPATCTVNKGCLGAGCSTCTRCWAEPTDSIIPIDGNIACQGQDNDTPFLVIDFTGSASTFDLNMFLEETPPANLYLRVNSNNALATSTRLTNASQIIIADQTPTGTQDANIWVWGEFEAYYPDDLNVSGTTDLNAGEFN